MQSYNSGIFHMEKPCESVIISMYGHYEKDIHP